MKIRSFQNNSKFTCHPNLKKNIMAILFFFFLIYLVSGSETGVNTTTSDENAHLLNNSTQLLNMSQNTSFYFGTLTICNGNGISLYCMMTLYDRDGSVGESNFSDTLYVETITPDSTLYIESEEQHLCLNVSLDNNSFDPVITIENYGDSNPVEHLHPPGSPLQYIQVDMICRK